MRLVGARSGLFAGVAGVIAYLMGGFLWAQDGLCRINDQVSPAGYETSPPCGPGDDSPCVETVSNGPDCLSCLCGSATLTGDWFGLPSSLGQSGITLDADVTQFYMGVTRGGLDREFRYSGHGDYVMNVDSAKLGGPEGLFVKLRAEHRFGESMAGATGAFLPSNFLADLPVADSEDLYLTNVLFTQMLSESFGVFAGKLDTLDGDANAFAHGRGKTQFSNAAFVVTPIGFRTVVYSTLGAGFIILQEGQPLFTFSVLNACFGGACIRSGAHLQAENQKSTTARSPTSSTSSIDCLAGIRYCRSPVR